jgi:hypothetical protein
MHHGALAHRSAGEFQRSFYNDVLHDLWLPHTGSIKNSKAKYLVEHISDFSAFSSSERGFLSDYEPNTHGFSNITDEDRHCRSDYPYGFKRGRIEAID